MKLFIFYLSLCFSLIAQAQISKTVKISSGGLSKSMSKNELNVVTNLTIRGSLDARDFLTMRDEMPKLAVLDLSGVTITSYKTNEGTFINIFQANTIPESAFYNPNTQLGKITLKSVVLPSSVTSIGSYAFAFCNSLIYTKIQSTVKIIGDYAFAGCSGNITVDENNPNYSSMDGVLFDKAKTTLIQYPISKKGSYNIPLSVKSIKDYAFFDCYQLTSVIIPSSVNNIGSAAFYNSSGLNSIYTNCLPVDIGTSYNIFFNVDKTKCTLFVPYCSKVLYSSSSQWKDFAKIEEDSNGFILSSSTAIISATEGGGTALIIKSNVSWTANSDQPWISVEPTSGNGNDTLILRTDANLSTSTRTAQITISAPSESSQTFTLNQIGHPKTFNVTAGELSTTLTESELSSISNLKLTGTIDARDFKTMRDNLPLLSDLDLSETTIVSYIGGEGTNIYSTEYIANTIPQYAFNNSNTNTGKTSLTSIRIPKSVTSIGEYAFSSCSSLTKINIPNSVTLIGSGAFYYCSGLSSIIIPDEVTSIAAGAFYNCTGLKNVTIGNSVALIGNSAFYNCNRLISLVIPNSVKSIGRQAFYNCSRMSGTLDIPKNVNSIGSQAFYNCNGFSEFNVQPGNSNYSSLNGVLFNKKQTILIQNILKKQGEYSIPNTVTTIENYAFLGSNSMTNITIPNSVISIGDYAFQNCIGLTKIIIPNSVTSIGVSAFRNCSGLITVDADNPNYSSIDGVQFDKTKSKLIQYPSSKQGSYTIPTLVKTIGDYAFYDCTALTSVTIPSSVVTIGNEAFYNCNNLKSIHTSSYPIDISASYNVFYNVDFTKCSLNIPYGAKALYRESNQWKDFAKIVEKKQGFMLNSNSIKITALGGIATAKVTANIPWKAFCDQNWLFVKPSNGTSSDTIKFTVEANNLTRTRTANIIFSIANETSQTIKIIQSGLPKTFNIVAGSLSSTLTKTDLAEISNLILIGTIDARDFKTMRDNMPMLNELDLSKVNIQAYKGAEGTLNTISTYPANTIPNNSFCNPNKWNGKINLSSVILPITATSIGESAFESCSGLTNLTIHSLISSIGNYAFYNCSSLSSIYVYNKPVDLSYSTSIFNNVNKTTCSLYIKFENRVAYESALQWKDFKNIFVFGAPVSVLEPLKKYSNKKSVQRIKHYKKKHRRK